MSMTILGIVEATGIAGGALSMILKGDRKSVKNTHNMIMSASEYTQNISLKVFHMFNLEVPYTIHYISLEEISNML